MLPVQADEEDEADSPAEVVAGSSKTGGIYIYIYIILVPLSFDSIS